MANRLVKQGRTTYVAAIPPVPAVPAYCVVQPAQAPQHTAGMRESGFRSAYGAGSALSGSAVGDGFNYGYYGLPTRPTGQIDPITGLPGVELAPGVTIPAGQSGVQAGTPVQTQTPPEFQVQYQGGQVCFPAVPGSPGQPGQVVNEDIRGWNGGARSIDSFAGDGYVRFRVAPRPVGVVAGFSNVDNSAAFNEATHAFYAHGTTLQVVERGQVVATLPMSPADNPLLTIVRRGGMVAYYAGDSWAFISPSGSGGTVFLDAALYSSGDAVDSPMIGPLSELSDLVAFGAGAATLPAAQGVGGENAYVTGGATLPALAGAGDATVVDYNAGAATLPATRGVGADRPYIAGAATLPAISAAGDSGFPSFVTASGSAVIPPIYGAGVGYPGDLGSGSVVLPAVFGYGADRPYAAGAGTLPSWRGYGDDGPEPGTYGVMEFIYLVDYLVSDPVIYAEIYDELGVASSATFLIVVDGTYYDGLLLTDTLSLVEILEAAINDGLVLNSGVSTTRQAMLQYAVNIATGALTTYQNFDFRGFVRLEDKRTFGWRPDGVYEIGGDTDDGARLNALLDFGATDFGTSFKKHVAAAFLGLGTDGCAYLRLTGDKKCERVYRVIQRDDICRSNPDRGITAREWHTVLEIVDATTADIDSIEWVVEVTSRRWTR